MSYHNNERFSTPDSDQDNDKDVNSHCAADYHSGWWYNYCVRVNLNGIYTVPGQTNFDSSLTIDWDALGDNEPLKRTEIMIRRKV